MKKKLLFTFACVMALMAGFVSCTNDDFEEFAPVAEMQKSAMTRTAGGMTQEEVQARLDELGEKYGINVKMLYVRDYSEFTESTFKKMEQNIIAYKNRAVNTNAVATQTVENDILDDSVIDEYEIATLSTNVEAGQDYDFFIDFGIEYHRNGFYPHFDYYSYRWGLNFSKGEYGASVDAELIDMNEMIPIVVGTSNSHVGIFRPSNVEYLGNNSYSFDFEFYILSGNTTVGLVNGEYYNGIIDMWAMTNVIDVIITLPDLNE